MSTTSSSSSSSSGGIGLLGATFIVFLVLKLTGVIDWSWWWVTAPLWVGWVFVAILVIVGGGIFATVRATQRRRRSARRARA